jgi:DNA-binding MarR family transcriptional regulator
VEPNWLTTNEMRAWRNYIETMTDLNQAIEADLIDLGLTLGDYQVLVYLSEANDQEMRMCDLASTLHLSPSGLTRRLDGLVAAGLVAREASVSDRRVMLAVITPPGLKLLKQSAPHHVASVRRHLFDHLTAKQVAALESIFGAISSGLCSNADADAPDEPSAVA